MEILRSFLDNALLSFALTAALAPIIIWILYKLSVVDIHVLMGNKANAEFVKAHAKKSGTPTMGGLIIIIPLIILSLIFVPAGGLRSTLLIGIVMFGIYGMLDKILVLFTTNNKKFWEFQESFRWRIGKLAILYILGVVSAYLISKNLGITSVALWPGFKVPFAGVFTLLWAAFITITVYSSDITDGLDGLVSGLYLAVLAALAAILWVEGKTLVLPIVAFIMGSLLVYLYFNITPARVFMGGVGDQPLGFILIFLAIYAGAVIPFVIMMVVFWIEFLSSTIQIFAIRYFHRKVFKIAPIHHHFEAIGWSEAKIVQRFWLAGVVLAVFGLWVWVLIR